MPRKIRGGGDERPRVPEGGRDAAPAGAHGSEPRRHVPESASRAEDPSRRARPPPDHQGFDAEDARAVRDLESRSPQLPAAEGDAYAERYEEGAKRKPPRER